jgi:NCAIR mutase (PurE)-related protein
MENQDSWRLLVLFLLDETPIFSRPTAAIFLTSLCRIADGKNAHYEIFKAMTKRQIKVLLHEYKNGAITDGKLLDLLIASGIESLGNATLDHHREMRQGFPEVILCEGKTRQQIAEIAKRIIRHGSILLATRATKQQFAATKQVVPTARYNKTARTISANNHLVKQRGRGTILIVTAGTSDIPVAEEALETARVMGNTTDMLVDVGVAGIHRILSQTDKLRKASVIIVVAGMDGALPSVIGGLVDVPVIAVPTSVGYGASFGGVAPLLTMLNSCAAGVLVVNINNGFGAGFAAATINRRRE